MERCGEKMKEDIENEKIEKRREDLSSCTTCQILLVLFLHFQYQLSFIFSLVHIFNPSPGGRSGSGTGSFLPIKH
jgi:hypothetical protein